MKKAYGFIQDWGSYSDQTLVCVGINNIKELVALAKKVGRIKPDVLEELSKGSEEHFKNAQGFFQVLPKTFASVLWLREWDWKDWKHYGILIHELHHAVYMRLQTHRGMDHEMEAMAYQQEYLFEEIRHKLCTPSHWTMYNANTMKKKATRKAARKPKLGTGARFKALTKKLSKKKGVKDPAGLAAYIGRKKYGKKKFQSLSAAGRRRKK